MKKTTKGALASVTDRMAYRSFLLVRALSGSWAISKNGAHIGWGSSAEDAKRIIDSLLEG